LGPRRRSIVAGPSNVCLGCLSVLLPPPPTLFPPNIPVPPPLTVGCPPCSPEVFVPFPFFSSFLFPPKLNFHLSLLKVPALADSLLFLRNHASPTLHVSLCLERQDGGHHCCLSPPIIPPPLPPDKGYPLFPLPNTPSSEVFSALSFPPAGSLVFGSFFSFAAQ